MTAYTIILTLLICYLLKCKVTLGYPFNQYQRTYLLTNCRKAVEELYSVHHKTGLEKPPFFSLNSWHLFYVKINMIRTGRNVQHEITFDINNK